MIFYDAFYVDDDDGGRLGKMKNEKIGEFKDKKKKKKFQTAVR